MSNKETGEGSSVNKDDEVVNSEVVSEFNPSDYLSGYNDEVPIDRYSWDFIFNINVRRTAEKEVCVICKHWLSGKCRDCIKLLFYNDSIQAGSVLRDHIFKKYEHVFLSPDQWEQRTGEKWTGAVWERSRNTAKSYSKWELFVCDNLALKLRYWNKYAWQILVCTGPEVPSDDWEGE
jgi:hypothetical protein